MAGDAAGGVGAAGGVAGAGAGAGAVALGQMKTQTMTTAWEMAA